MRIWHLLLLFSIISLALAELKRKCVCGTQRIPCDCPPEQKLSSLRSRVFRAFSVPSAPAPRPIQPPQYFAFSRNVQSLPPGPSASIDQPIGYVLTTSPAEAFYLDASTGQLIPTTRPRPFPVQTVDGFHRAFVPSQIQPQPVQFHQPVPNPPLTTATRQSFLVSGGTPEGAFRMARMIRHPIAIQQYTPQYNPAPIHNPGVPSMGIPPPGIPLPVSAPYFPPQQPPLQFRTIQPQQSRPSPVLGSSEPNLVPVSQLSRVVKQRHVKQFTLDKPRPGDVEDFSFVDAGNGIEEEDDIDRKYKSFISGAPPSASIGEPAQVVRTKPRSLLETLPPGLIAKVANKIASKLPPPKFSFSITPSKSQATSFH